MHGGATAALLAAQAIKAFGTVVTVEPGEFQRILDRNPEGLVVHAEGRLFSPKHKYLTSYQGLAFYTASREPISLPHRCQVVEAKSLSIPG